MEASLSAKGTNVISAENSTGAQLSTDAKLTLTGSTKITAPLYGIMTRNASQTSVDAQGGTLTIATGVPYGQSDRNQECLPFRKK